MRFKERNDLANRCKEWMEDKIRNNITIPFDPVHLVLAYLDVSGYLNKVVRCNDCKHFHDGIYNGEYWMECDEYRIALSSDEWFCADGERREDDKG